MKNNYCKISTLPIVHSVKEKIVFLLIIFSLNAFAQPETNHWYFGNNAGLDFSNGDLNVTYDGNMSTPAGCSSISSRQGDLLFYTNGETIWNRNHQIMSNGSGLAGDTNHTQTSIIVPKPDDENIYYVFSIRDASNNSFISGVYYSIVDFSNDPLGEVTLKNALLIPTSTQRITAIYHPESNSTKVIALGKALFPPNDDTFFIFNISSIGVTTLPGIPMLLLYGEEILSTAGTMKVSPNSKYLAVADNDQSRIFMFDFDINNNSITNFTFLNTGFIGPPVPPYGLEFSPDSEVIYFSVRSGLYKYVINSSQQINDKIFVGGSNAYNFGALQLANNGKIYIANYNESNGLNAMQSLGVINDPNNTEEETDYVASAINLSPGGSYKGLPNFVQSFFRNRIITENRCVSDVFDFQLDAYTTIQSVVWEFGDGNTSTDFSPDHMFSVAGEYTVKATITINNRPIELFKKIDVFPLPSINPGESILQCDSDNDGTSFFNLFTIENRINNPTSSYQLAFYNSNDDALSDTDPIENPSAYQNQSSPQELFVKITSAEGCVTISNFFIETVYTNLGNISNMYTCESSDGILNNGEGRFNLRSKTDEIATQFNIPESSTISFYATIQDAQTQTNPLELYHITSSTTIWVRVENEDFSCSGIEPIQLVVNAELVMNILDNYIICDPAVQPPIVLDGDTSNHSWEWRNSSGVIISTLREFTLTQPGTFSLTVYRTQNNIECSISKTFGVANTGTVTFNNIIAEDYQISVSVNGNSDYEYSLDNVSFSGNGTAHTFFNIEPGVYTIYVRDKNNCEHPISTNVSLIGFPKYFTPNNDGYNDTWRIEGIRDDLYKYVAVHIYDRYGKFLFYMNLEGNYYGWDGIYNGKVLIASDYWFTAILTDTENNTFKRSGHFSLKH